MFDLPFSMLAPVVCHSMHCMLCWCCLYNARSLQGDKNIIKFEGDHNSPRPQFYFDSINIFFHNVLQPPEDEVGGAFLDPMDDYFGKVN
jgi:hypothetical protein